MDQRLRDRASILIAGVGVIISLVVVLFARFDPGVVLTTSGSYVIVDDVEPRSIAAQNGLHPGMVVLELQGVTLVQMPQYVEPEIDVEATPNPVTGEFPPVVPRIEPPAPVVVNLDSALVEELLSLPPMHLVAVDPWVVDEQAAGIGESGIFPDGYQVVYLYDDGIDGIRMRLPTLIAGALLLLVIGWWLASGRGGPALRPMAAPVALATSMPFVVEPLYASWSPPMIALAGLLTTAAMLPLALALLERIEDAEVRRGITFAVAGVTGTAALVSVIAMWTPPWQGEDLLRWTLIAAIPLLPGIAAAGPIQRSGATPVASGRLLETAEYAAVGVTPGIALASTGPGSGLPLLLWFVLVLSAGRFTIRPLARLATRATLQRDLVVAATEAERARVAADIHDDALQELTLLVHRLDAAGDTEGADIARTVSDRLRAICGDLRLPILDDLGVGPALDWLVLRIERLAGGEVRLERSDGTRPPADVELAFFRVAQEALANAVKHGKPPILVRYATTPGGATLSIDDAGPGIEPDAGEGADRAGHFGLLNMQQRAEAIGAILDVRRWPSGGTHVALDWRAH
jgi:signal transduction histidine kinase